MRRIKVTKNALSTTTRTPCGNLLLEPRLGAARKKETFDMYDAHVLESNW